MNLLSPPQKLYFFFTTTHRLGALSTWSSTLRLAQVNDITILVGIHPPQNQGKHTGVFTANTCTLETAIREGREGYGTFGQLKLRLRASFGMDIVLIHIFKESCKLHNHHQPHTATRAHTYTHTHTYFLRRAKSTLLKLTTHDTCH